MSKEEILIDPVLEVNNDQVFIRADKAGSIVDPVWCEYKGEVYVGQLNYEQSKKSGRTMIDLSYCMTKALNQVIMKTVRWDKNKFNLNPKRFR